MTRRQWIGFGSAGNGDGMTKASNTTDRVRAAGLLRVDLLQLGAEGANQLQHVRNPGVERAGYRRWLCVSDGSVMVVNEGV